MPSTPCDANVHMHPAMRDRVLRVSTDLRLKCLALSGVGAANLEGAIARLEDLMPANSPFLHHSDRQIAAAIARLLRLICMRLTAWENGEWPTLAETSAVANGLTCCQRLLAQWESVVEDRRHR